MRKKGNMWRYLMDFIAIILGAILVTLGVLFLTYMFEKYSLHVPGSREMWIGLIGAILGGAYTLLGVKITIRRQKQLDDEKQLLENMPILQFKTYNSCLQDFHGNGIFTIDGNEVFTTKFPKNESINYPIIEISLASANPAFDVRIDLCITTEHKRIPYKTKYYFPQEYRLVANEKLQNMFCISDYKQYPHCNVQGILRIAYSDLFGTPYYQDISFTYNEQLQKSESILSIDRIFPPIIATKRAPTLGERVKIEYSYSDEK